MPPMPKDPAVRRRRNKSSSARTLRSVTSSDVPDLPDGRPWRAETLRWWQDVWSSPMAPEYHSTDVHGLLILAALVDAFWSEPSRELAGEIRLQRQCFGLTPIDRRRLEWVIDQGEEAAAKTAKRRSTRKPTPAEDPRRLLA